MKKEGKKKKTEMIALGEACPYTYTLLYQRGFSCQLLHPEEGKW